MTSTDGTFDIMDLPQGRYAISVNKVGFLPAPGQGPSARDRPITLTLADKQRVEGQHFQLIRGGAIAGRIFGQYGEPVAEAIVTAYRIVQRSPGSPELEVTRSATTNDLGDFRVYGLAPGSYYLQGSYSTPVAEGLGLAPTFYPAAIAIQQAERIRVNAGETALASLGLVVAKLARVAGSVTDAAGRPGRDAVMLLAAAGAELGTARAPFTTEVDASGRFAFAGVVPGEYRLTALSKSKLEATERNRAPSASTALGRGAIVAGEEASMPLTIAGVDIVDLAIRTDQSALIEGHVRVEGPAPAADVLARLRVVSHSADAAGLSSTFLMSIGPVAADGTFRMYAGVGRRVIRLEGLPTQWVLDSVSVNGVDVTDEGFELAQSNARVEIAVSASTNLTGTVQRIDGSAGAGCTVVVFPEDPRRLTMRFNRFMGIARAGADGTFLVSGLPPGRYLAFAVTTPPDDGWASPDWLAGIRARATPITLGKGERKTVNLRLAVGLAEPRHEP